MTMFIPPTGIESARTLALSARPDAPVLPDEDTRPHRLAAWLHRLTTRGQPRAGQPQPMCAPVPKQA